MKELLIDSNKDVLKVELKDSKGNSKGKYWQFDLEDIELPLKVSDMFKEVKDNENWAKAQIIALGKKQDEPYDDILTKNEKAEIEVMKEYFKKQSKALNKVLGDTAVEDFLEIQGRSYYFTMHYDIMKYVDMLKPMLDENVKSVSDVIKAKYNNKESDILE